MNPLLKKYLLEAAMGGGTMPPSWETGDSVAGQDAASAAPPPVDLMSYFKGIRPEMFSQEAITAAQAEDAQTNRNRDLGRSFAQAAGYFTGRGPDYTGLEPTTDAQKALAARQGQALTSAEVGGKVGQFMDARADGDPTSAKSMRAYAIAMQDPRTAAVVTRLGRLGQVSVNDMKAALGYAKTGLEMGKDEATIAKDNKTAEHAGEQAESERGLRSGKIAGQAAETRLKNKQAAKIDAEIADLSGKKDAAKADQAGKTESELRKEFQGTPMFTQANEVNNAYRKVLAAPADPKGDIALVYSYVKILDPGSVVREGEIQLSKEGRSYETQVKAWVTKAKTGEGFTPEERKQFRNSAKSLYDAQMQSYRSASENYKRLAAERGVKPENVVLDMSIGADSTPGGGTHSDLGFEPGR